MTNSLAKHRLAAGLTQVELAEQSGLSTTWISHLETGRKTATWYLRSLVPLLNRATW